MSLFSKRTLVTFACAAALGALTATPSLAGVITPTDKSAVSTESPIDSVHYWHGWRHHHHHHHHWRAATPVYIYPSYPYAWGGWGWGPGWGPGWGFGLGGLFPFF